MNEKKNIRYVFIAIAGLFVLFAVMVASEYNGMATGREAVSTARADIDAALQRRADLIPNLVAVCKNFAAHETEVFDKVLAAREKIMGAGAPEEKAAADESLTRALRGLNVIVENYPELKSDATYISLMDELAGGENRIAVARRDFNASVREYNNRIVRLPGSMLASLFGFQRIDYFEAAGSAAAVPDAAKMLGGSPSK